VADMGCTGAASPVMVSVDQATVATVQLVQRLTERKDEENGTKCEYTHTLL
jgi:hypothetical protein